MDDDPFKRRDIIVERRLPRDPAGFGAPLAFPHVTNGLDYLVSATGRPQFV